MRHIKIRFSILIATLSIFVFGNALYGQVMADGKSLLGEEETDLFRKELAGFKRDKNSFHVYTSFESENTCSDEDEVIVTIQ